MGKENELNETVVNSDEIVKKEFTAKISSSAVNMEGFAFVTDQECIDLITTIAGIELKTPFKRPPKFEEPLLFFHPKKKMLFRAIRLKSNLAAFHQFKLFLYDTGETYWIKIEENPKFFEIPKKFAYLPQKLEFCFIDNFPDIGLNKDDFIDEMLKHSPMLQFNAKKAEQVWYDEVNCYVDCLFVDVKFVKEEMALEIRQKLGENKLTIVNLNKLNEETSPPMELTYSENRTMAVDIVPKKFLPPKNSHVLVYPMAYITSNWIFGQVQSATRDYAIERLPLSCKTAWMMKTKMNDRRLEFKKLEKAPIKEQLVIASKLETQYNKKEKENFFYRMMVLDIENDICRLFSIDFGFYAEIDYKNLFEFPIEFLETPPSAFRIKFINVECENEKSSKAIELFKRHLEPFGVGIVKEISVYDIHVKIFTRDGKDVNKLLAEN